MNHRVGQAFAQCIFDCNLIDLGYKGPLFTWRSSVVNVPLLSLDHCGVWLRPQGDFFTRDHEYFKFLGSWLEHDDFGPQVRNAWRYLDSWSANIAHLTSRLSTWNREIYGNLFKRKRRLLGRLEGID